MISTIIFDLSDVYLQGIFGSHTYVEKKIKMPVSDTYFYIDEFNQFMLGKITEDVYWQAVIKNNGWNISVDALKKETRKNFTGFFAVSLISVSIVSVLGNLKSAFALLYGILLTLFFPKLSKNHFQKKTLGIKIFLIAIMFVGLYLIFF